MTDLEFINDPMEWPRWPVLPMKRTTADGQLEVGIVFASGKPEVFAGSSIFALGEIPGKTWGDKLKALDCHNFESFEALLKVWRID